MEDELKKWKVVLIAHSKTFRGEITALPAPLDSRTISILNHQKNVTIDNILIPKEFIRLENAIVSNRTGPPLKYESLMVKKSEIILAYDGFEKMGQDTERQRQSKIATNTASNIEIITKAIGFNTWYRITGNVSNFNAKIERDNFVPLTSVLLEKVVTLTNTSIEDGGLKETFQIHKSNPVELSFLALHRNNIQAYQQSAS